MSFNLSEVYAQTQDPSLAVPEAETVVPESDTAVSDGQATVPSVEPVAPTVEPTVSPAEPEVPSAEPSVDSPERNFQPDEPALPDAEPIVPSSEPPVLSPGGTGAPSAEPGVSSGEAASPSTKPVTPIPEATAPNAEPLVARSQPAALTLATPKPQPQSEIKIGKLSFGFVTSYYQPELSTINGILGNRQIAILADPNYLLPGNPAFRVETRNIVVDDLGANPWVGMEAKWELSPSFAVAFTGGVWRAESLATDTIITFLRSNLPQIEVPRSARYNLLMDQFLLDWRYYFLNDPRRGRVSLDLGILGVTVGFFTLDSVMKVVHPAAPRGGFAAVSSTEANGVSFVSRYGFTGEYFLTNKLALGFSGHYLVGRMTQLKINRHFPAGFPQIPVPEPLSIRPGVPLPSSPPTPNEGDTLRYATTITDQRGVENVGPQQNVILELDGPEVSGYVRFYF